MLGKKLHAAILTIHLCGCMCVCEAIYIDMEGGRGGFFFFISMLWFLTSVKHFVLHFIVQKVLYK